MQLPTPQGLTSKTFKQPPLDGSLLLPEIFDYHAEQSPDHPLFRYVDARNILHTISWSRAVKAFHNAARITRQRVEAAGGRRPMVGILAAAGEYSKCYVCFHSGLQDGLDQIAYFSVIAGILRAGYQAFPISPRNSDLAVAHLVQSTACSHIFVSADPAMQKLAGAAGDKISALGGELNIVAIPTFEELFDSSVALGPIPQMEKFGLDEPAVILHSSGTQTASRSLSNANG
jgi:acyl-CoA synthetase (AMP-forming)/AMP-acid ligase II